MASQRSYQYMFIDDSGDPGFKFRSGSTRIFVIACVIFDNPEEVENTSAKVKALKNKLGWIQDREFKFHRTNDEQKKAFFTAVRKCSFRVRAIVVDKTKIREPKLRKSESFYNHVITMVLAHFENMSSAKVILDGSGNKNFRKRSTANLRRKLNSEGKHKLADFTLRDSRSEVLIQLADMVAGAIRAKYDPDRVARYDYLKSIKSRIEDIWSYEN